MIISKVKQHKTLVIKNLKFNQNNINHKIDSIITKAIGIRLNYDITESINTLKKIGSNIIQSEKGSFLFKNLKINISKYKSSGDTENKLAYFCSSKNMIHLLK